MIVGRKALKLAVRRNRARRLLREAFRARFPALADRDVVFRLKKPTGDRSMRALYDEATLLLERASPT